MFTCSQAYVKVVAMQKIMNDSGLRTAFRHKLLLSSERGTHDLWLYETRSEEKIPYAEKAVLKGCLKVILKAFK